MRIVLAVACVLGVLGSRDARAEDLRAKTADGKEVILKADGTWAYASEAKREPAKKKGEYTKDAKAALAYTGKRGTFSLSLPPNTWKKMDKVDNEAAEAGFLHKDGDIYALVIAERIDVPLETLKRAVLQNIRTHDEDAKIVLEEKRTVNGKEILCLTFEATVTDIPVTYYGYYYSGDEGSIQILTYTGRKLFKEYKPDMEAFLNGFEIIKKQN
ncbi:hypothetical protein [Limnoglobus roseus]|uniref:Uncharacterized protein n=1 Tax=Limnoglobus roseus TaxID=2598579 RepID=A0A5C1A457_9BACT|nr:hypothetical protein [Limnoglobus roseus]QEL13410.1 hypothetical protein PX52LOC_00265 [Limnoglobus roseus]